jgi:hypothetical protein
MAGKLRRRCHRVNRPEGALTALVAGAYLPHPFPHPASPCLRTPPAQRTVTVARTTRETSKPSSRPRSHGSPPRCAAARHRSSASMLDTARLDRRWAAGPDGVERGGRGLHRAGPHPSAPHRGRPRPPPGPTGRGRGVLGGAGPAPGRAAGEGAAPCARHLPRRRLVRRPPGGRSAAVALAGGGHPPRRDGRLSGARHGAGGVGERWLDPAPAEHGCGRSFRRGSCRRRGRKRPRSPSPGQRRGRERVPRCGSPS